MGEANILGGRHESGRILQLEIRAQKILAEIEARCTHLRDSSAQARAALLTGNGGSESEKLAQPPAPDAAPLRIQEINRYTNQWKALAPVEAEGRAALIRVLSRKYPIRSANYCKLQSALGFDDPTVQAAYLELYEQDLETALVQPQEAQPPAGLDPDEARLASVNEVVQEWDLLEEDEKLDWFELRSGETLFDEGDPGDALYIVISGRLRSESTQYVGGDAFVEIGRGEVVGAVEVLTGGVRARKVAAIRDSELLRIAAADLLKLAETRPQIMSKLVTHLAVRLQAQNLSARPTANSLVSFALIYAGDRSNPGGPAFQRSALKEFPALFAEALRPYGATLHLNSEILDQKLGQGWAQTPQSGADNGKLAAYLSEQEAHYRYVVYETDAGASQWTERCLRQADRALIVAESRSDPRPGPVEALLGRMQAQTPAELVLVHPSWGSIRGTQRWLAARQVRGHHQVRLNSPADMQRMARRLTGRALGLVLSGGGARGYAHIGAWRALKEAGLEIDLVGGTSMGAIIAGMLAMDIDEKEMYKLARQAASPFKLFDLTLPLVSFFKSEKATQTLRSIFGDTQIEDFNRPYFCVSSSLTRARTIVHTSGPAWEAVRASSAIPGVFSPLLREDELLVDGAVLNNLPVDIMQEFAGCGPIIGVNVFPEVDLERDYKFGASVSGWEVALRKLNPLAESVPAPTIFENLLRVVALNDVHQAKAKSQLCELYISPRVERFGILDFSAYKKIIEIGYQSAVEAIEAWSRGERPAPAEAEPEPAPLDTLGRSLADLERMLEELSPTAV